jgi:hypothetical protein
MQPIIVFPSFHKKRKHDAPPPNKNLSYCMMHDVLNIRPPGRGEGFEHLAGFYAYLIWPGTVDSTVRSALPLPRLHTNFIKAFHVRLHPLWRWWKLAIHAFMANVPFFDTLNQHLYYAYPDLVDNTHPLSSIFLSIISGLILNSDTPVV